MAFSNDPDQGSPPPLTGAPSLHHSSAPPTILSASWLLFRARRLLVVAGLVLAGLPVLTSSPAWATPGDLDTSFGFGNGWFRLNSTNAAKLNELSGMTRQFDGKFVMVGNSSYTPIVARATQNGWGLDTDFSKNDGDGIDGVKMLPYGISDVKAVAMQPTAMSGDKIVVVGSYTSGGVHDFGVARLNLDGTMDTTFPLIIGVPGSGMVATDFGGTDAANAVVIQSDGKIVVAGSSDSSFALARYNGDGNLDTSFGSGGKVTTNLAGGTDSANAVFVQSDGKIVAGGKGNTGIFDWVRYNSNGSLDTSFSGDGKQQVSMGTGSGVKGMAVQSDGKIVSVGSKDRDFAAVRLNTNGSLDTSFDGDGKVTTDMSGVDAANAVGIQSNGRIVAVGGSGNEFALARYTTAGALDTAFSGDGKTVVPYPWGTSEVATAVVIESNDRIVAGGSGPIENFFLLGGFHGAVEADVSVSVVGAPDPVVVNNSLTYTVTASNGNIDAAGNVVVAQTLPPGSRVSSISTTQGSCWRTPNEGWATAVQADGKIVVAGSVGTGADADIVVARYTAGGDLDTTFGLGGQRVIDIGGSGVAQDWARGVAIQSDGKIVVAGTTWSAGTPDVTVVRLSSSGDLDTTFDSDGKAVVVLSGDQSGNAVVVQADGKIVVGGSTGSGAAADMLAVRLTTTGVLDTSYGTGGVVVGPIPGSDAAYAVKLDSVGRAVLAGESDVLGDADFAAMRLNTDGSLDTTFDSDGVVVFNIDNTAQRAYGLAIDASDKPVLGGETWKIPAFGPANWDFAALRYNTNGTPDTSFDTDGFLTTPVHDYGNDTIGSLAIQSDGNIVAAGSSWGASSVDFAAARYTPTGVLDTSFDTDGKAVHSINNATTDGAHAITLDTDGKALLIGSSNFAGGELAGIRLSTTGGLDTTFHGDGIIADHTANITGTTLTCHLGTLNPGANATITITTTPTTTGQITTTATITATQPDPNTTNNTTQTTTQINP